MRPRHQCPGQTERLHFSRDNRQTALPDTALITDLIDGERSQLHFVSSRYLLPATLVLLTIAIYIPAIVRLGPKALILFLTGTVGVIIGGPIAMFIVRTFSPETVSGFAPDLTKSK